MSKPIELPAIKYPDIQVAIKILRATEACMSDPNKLMWIYMLIYDITTNQDLCTGKPLIETLSNEDVWDTRFGLGFYCHGILKMPRPENQEEAKYYDQALLQYNKLFDYYGTLSDEDYDKLEDMEINERNILLLKIMND